MDDFRVGWPIRCVTGGIRQATPEERLVELERAVYDLIQEHNGDLPPSMTGNRIGIAALLGVRRDRA